MENPDEFKETFNKEIEGIKGLTVDQLVNRFIELEEEVQTIKAKKLAVTYHLASLTKVL